jgi:hypothetical protein
VGTTLAFVAALTYDVSYAQERNRVTTLFRIFLAIPHLIVAGVWAYLAEILAVVQWFVILFTGKRNQGMWDLQYAWLGYYSRVYGYVELLYDPYPAFGTDPGPVPVTSELSYDEPADRLTNGLRFIWAIPALFVSLGLAIALGVVVLISWFAIVITGKHPRGMFDFILSALRYILRTQSYVLLMTDTYPRYDAAGQPNVAWTPPPTAPGGGPRPSPAQPHGATAGGPLPPPTT